MEPLVNPVRRNAALALMTVLHLAVATGCASREGPDPLESTNRKIFAFNESVDRYALGPAATAWDFVVPDFVQTGLDNFFNHLDMPLVLVHDILQGKPIAAFEDLARITHNTVFGFGGFYDIATQLGIPENDEDFGQTLGHYGMPPGPYIVAPLLGPFTVRDGFGEIVDTVATGYLYSPIWTSAQTLNLDQAELWGVSIGRTGLELLNLRAIFDEELEESRKDAFDYYVFVRNAYLQSRAAKVADQSDAPVVDEDELYFFDEEEFEDEDDEDYDDF